MSKTEREARDSVARKLQQANGGRGNFSDYQRRVGEAMRKGENSRKG